MTCNETQMTAADASFRNAAWGFQIITTTCRVSQDFNITRVCEGLNYDNILI